MAIANSEQTVREVFGHAGITLNGTNPWDIKVHDSRFYARLIAEGSLGLGESYMDGWWDAPALDQFMTKILAAKLDERPISWKELTYYLRAKFLNLQDKIGAREVMDKHYNLPAELYMSFLDPYNQYTCGYFKDTEDLNRAQEQKLDLICRKLELKPNDRVLDIGCGWGGFSKFAAKQYGCQVTGISISDEQIKYATEFTQGLPVKILKSDYRDFKGEFDKVLVCGMIEHVGFRNYRELVAVAERSLVPGGLFLLHTIGGNKSEFSTDPWLHKYIFPNSMLPSITQLGKAFEGLFVMEDWHNFSAYYDKTCVAWMENFDRAWPKLKNQYDERFYRMWKYYLLCCAASFRVRKNQLWQIVLSKGGVPGGYTSVR